MEETVVVVDEASGFWLPSEFPYDIHENQYDAVEDIALGFAGKLKLDSAGGPAKPVNRNTAAHFYPPPETPTPHPHSSSVFHETKFQRQLYQKRMIRTEATWSNQFDPNRSNGSGRFVGRMMCAGTGVFLPRTHVNSDLPNKTRAKATKKVRAADGFVQSRPQTHHFPFNKPIEPVRYSSIMARRQQMILLQKQLCILAAAERSLIMGREMRRLPHEWSY